MADQDTPAHDDLPTCETCGKDIEDDPILSAGFAFCSDACLEAFNEEEEQGNG